MEATARVVHRRRIRRYTLRSVAVTVIFRGALA